MGRASPFTTPYWRDPPGSRGSAAAIWQQQHHQPHDDRHSG